MAPWMKNAIGAAVILVLIVIAWRIFQGDGGEAKVWEFGVKVNPRVAAASSAQVASAPASAVAQATPPAVAARQCRLPANGIESWAKSEQWAADSDWRTGGSSPAEFCGSQKLAREARHQDRTVVLLGTDEKHKSEYTPFKNDFYRYTCLFEDRWEPVYRLALNTACPAP